MKIEKIKETLDKIMEEHPKCCVHKKDKPLTRCDSCDGFGHYIAEHHYLENCGKYEVRV